jgi:hypothetical protein
MEEWAPAFDEPCRRMTLTQSVRWAYQSCDQRRHREGMVSTPMETPAEPVRELSAAELGAVAHLYRGEVYRSTIWRTRLDNTTNWSVVTLGLALSITFASPDASSPRTTAAQPHPPPAPLALRHRDSQDRMDRQNLWLPVRS